MRDQAEQQVRDRARPPSENKVALVKIQEMIPKLLTEVKETSERNVMRRHKARMEKLSFCVVGPPLRLRRMKLVEGCTPGGM